MPGQEDQLTALMSGGGGGGNPMAGAGAQPSPGGGPMTTPQPKEGLAQAAMVNVAMSLKLLEQSISAFGSTSDEGKAILKAMTALTKTFGAEKPKSDSLIPAELMQMMQAIPGAGGGSPAAKAMGAQPAGQPALPQPAA